MVKRRVARGLIAILAADVVGYSRLIRADEDGTLELLEALRQDIVYPTIADHGGRVVKLISERTCLTPPHCTTLEGGDVFDSEMHFSALEPV